MKLLQFDLKLLFLFSTAVAFLVWGWSNHQSAKVRKEKLVAALESLSKRCEPIGSKFDNAGVIQVGNMLRSMGENDAVEILREYLRSHPVTIRRQSNGLELVVPLVFETNESQPFSMEGGPTIVLCNDIPFNTTHFYARNGEPVDYEKYLNDAASKCTFIDKSLNPQMPISGYKEAITYAQTTESTEFIEQQIYYLLGNLIGTNESLYSSIDESKLRWVDQSSKFQYMTRQK